MAEISECNIFFSTLNGILTFFSHSSKRTFAIQEHSKKSTSVSVKHVFPIVFPNRRYFNVLQSKNVDIMTCLNVIRDFEKQLDNNRKGFTHCNNCKQKLERGEIRVQTNCGNCEKDGFSPVWEKTISMVGQHPFSRRRAHRPS